MNITKMRRTVRYIVQLLVNGEYERLETLTNSQRLNAAEIKSGVTDYGRTLILPPVREFNDLDIVTIERASPVQWDVRVSLWTKEEGKSDLTLELTVKDNNKELYDFQLDNIHVL